MTSSKASSKTWDCLIIGGGPAGLTAAIYLARFRRSVRVFDRGHSRAEAIPLSHNYPGCREGISGAQLLRQLREQAARYDVPITSSSIDRLSKANGGFIADAGGEPVRASRVLLATGISDETPGLPTLQNAVAEGILRYCPICDAYEALDKKIAVVGPIRHAAAEASFLRTYSGSVTVIPVQETAEHDNELIKPGVGLAPAPAEHFRQTSSGVAVQLRSGEWKTFDVLYAALGCNVHSELATALGAKCDSVGNLHVDPKQKTSVEGLYAAGDVVSGLHQLSVAEGQAAIAATAIHNSLPGNPR